MTRIFNGIDIARIDVRLRIDVFVFSGFGVTVAEQHVADTAQMAYGVDAFVEIASVDGVRVHPGVGPPEA